jgi:hypothetical protein
LSISRCIDWFVLVYYRVYDFHCAVLSTQPADSNKPFVGRLNVDCIPPPHTVASIKRCISKLEHIPKPEACQLFASISSEYPMSGGHISILTSDHHGSTPGDPMAFVKLTEDTPTISPNDRLGYTPQSPTAVVETHSTWSRVLRVKYSEGKLNFQLYKSFHVQLLPHTQSPISSIRCGYESQRARWYAPFMMNLGNNNGICQTAVSSNLPPSGIRIMPLTISAKKPQISTHIRLSMQRGK